eukprot:Gb_28500 [translate_table: standard]
MQELLLNQAELSRPLDQLIERCLAKCLREMAYHRMAKVACQLFEKMPKGNVLSWVCNGCRVCPGWPYQCSSFSNITRKHEAQANQYAVWSVLVACLLGNMSDRIVASCNTMIAGSLVWLLSCTRQAVYENLQFAFSREKVDKVVRGAIYIKCNSKRLSLMLNAAIEVVFKPSRILNHIQLQWPQNLQVIVWKYNPMLIGSKDPTN